MQKMTAPSKAKTKFTYNVELSASDIKLIQEWLADRASTADLARAWGISQHNAPHRVALALRRLVREKRAKVNVK